LAREAELDAVFMNVSFVGSSALAKELGSDVDGVVVTQVVPHPESDHSGVQQFRSAMQKHASGTEPGFVSLEGYLAAKIFSEGLQNAGKSLTREGHIDALEGLGSFEIGIGEPVSLTKTNHQASHKLWPTTLRNGKFVPLQWSELAGFHASRN
jgi:ABC-type branched-subunit amino acid transport system substrate-binding protein